HSTVAVVKRLNAKRHHRSPVHTLGARSMSTLPSPASHFAVLNFVQEYWMDAWQRSVLMLDVLRQRGNTHLEMGKRRAPHALTFKFEVVRDGRSLQRPVNYALTYIVPPEGTTIDPSKPPFVVVDPRAGHGPGIGGMKQESEIGVALAAGHPCYFVGFLPHPVP